jgi:lysophospholipase L1-like esterase
VRSSKFIINSVLLFSIGLTILFFFGFLDATKIIETKGDKVEKQTTKTEKSKANNKIILGLGDSLTKGIGDEKGEGYFQKTINKLNKTNNQVKGINFAVSGAKTNDLISTINQNGVKNAIKESNIILVTIGGNDLFPGWDELSPSVISNSKFNNIEFAKNMETIFTTINSINPNTKIYWLTLYNPFEEFVQLGNTNEYVQIWNYEAEKISNKYGYVTVVPVFDLFKGNTSTLLYTDKFHPNSLGYEAISERIIQHLETEVQRIDGALNE